MKIPQIIKNRFQLGTQDDLKKRLLDLIFSEDFDLNAFEKELNLYIDKYNNDFNKAIEGLYEEASQLKESEMMGEEVKDAPLRPLRMLIVLALLEVFIPDIMQGDGGFAYYGIKVSHARYQLRKLYISNDPRFKDILESVINDIKQKYPGDTEYIEDALKAIRNTAFLS